MSKLVRCPNPNCGREVAPAAACPLCGYPMLCANGTPVPATAGERWAQVPIDEAEILADLREVERTGGTTLDDFIEELERRTLLGRESAPAPTLS
jgi:hypothetical protein